MPEVQPNSDPSDGPSSTDAEPTTVLDPVVEPAVDPEQVAAFEQSAQESRQAIRDRDFDRAGELITDLADMSETGDQDKRVARLNALLHYFSGFWEAAQKAAAGLAPNDQLKVGDSFANVVSVTAAEIEIRHRGRNQTYPLNELPGWLGLALAEHWLDDNEPSSKLFLGAFHALDPEGKPKEARKLWQAATRAGQPADDLLLELDAARPEKAQ